MPRRTVWMGRPETGVQVVPLVVVRITAGLGLEVEPTAAHRRPPTLGQAMLFRTVYAGRPETGVQVVPLVVVKIGDWPLLKGSPTAAHRRPPILGQATPARAVLSGRPETDVQVVLSARAWRPERLHDQFSRETATRATSKTALASGSMRWLLRKRFIRYSSDW